MSLLNANVLLNVRHFRRTRNPKRLKMWFETDSEFTETVSHGRSASKGCPPAKNCLCIILKAKSNLRIPLRIPLRISAHDSGLRRRWYLLYPVDRGWKDLQIEFIQDQRIERMESLSIFAEMHRSLALALKLIGTRLLHLAIKPWRGFSILRHERRSVKAKRSKRNFNGIRSTYEKRF